MIYVGINALEAFLFSNDLIYNCRMKHLKFFSYLLTILIIGCSSDSQNEVFEDPPFTTNGYEVNGEYYGNNFSFSSGQEGITAPFILSFFSEHPTFNNTPFYIAFQLKPSSKITGEHQIKSTPIEYVVESNDSENPIIVDGDASLFVSGRAVVYEAEFNNENELIYIEIAYWINWEGITIKGFYKGSVI